jgi:hypothetical protein
LAVSFCGIIQGNNNIYPLLAKLLSPSLPTMSPLSLCLTPPKALTSTSVLVAKTKS